MDHEVVPGFYSVRYLLSAMFVINQVHPLGVWLLSTRKQFHILSYDINLI